MSEFIEAIESVPLLSLMLVIALGYSLGRISLRGVSLGPAGGTLFVSLALGHLGVSAGADPNQAGALTLGTLGFALFIYSVGFDAAPHFFSCFREGRGWRFVAVGVVASALAVAATLAFGHLLGLGGSASAGLLAGALTSAPTYAAASAVAPDPTRLSAAFAITYPFGLVSLVLLIQLLPRLLREDLASDAASEDEVWAGRARARPSTGAAEQTRAFVVSEAGAIGRSLRELALTRRTGCVISRLHRADGDVVLIPDGDTRLEERDHVIATGRPDELRAFEGLVGSEAFEREIEEPRLPTRRIQVRSRQAFGRTLEQLRIIGRFHCVVTKVERGTLWLEPDAHVSLVRHDVLEVVGARDDVRALARFLGRFEPPLAETDLAVYAGGIVLGLGLGALHVEIFGFDLRLGSAGGLLLVGLVLGWQERIGPLRTHVPREARQLVRDLGILLFVGETGLAAGVGVAEALRTAPWQTFAAGAAVNAVAVIGALAVARFALALRPIDAWGSVCGGLTSAAALQAVRRAAGSNQAAISYAAAYAVASVLATLAGPLVVFLL